MGELIHGARSKPLESTDISRIERRWKERYGTKLGQLSAYQRGCLREFARAERVLERYDAVMDTSGPLSAENEPKGFMASYLAALNTTGRALERLEQSMGHQAKERDKHALLNELAKYRGSAV
jgi:hypothetical protein